MSPEDHKRVRFNGRIAAAAPLVNMAGTGGSTEAIESYAAGMVDGVRDFLTAYRGDKVAYDTLQRAADRQAAPLVTEKP